jgi:hypothetical protein
LKASGSMLLSKSSHLRAFDCKIKECGQNTL